MNTQAQTQRFAVIDNDAGLIWWCGDAESAEAACQAADLTGGEVRGQYRWAPKNSGEHGYFVYQAPEGFEVNDGSDSTEIAAVEAMPFLGLYVPYGE